MSVVRNAGLALAAALMLTGCGPKEQAPEARASAATASPAGACNPGERQLAGSGLCESAALALMPKPEKIYEDGCRWVLSETGLPDGEWVVYRALACKTGETRLALGDDAGRMTLVLAASSFGEQVVKDRPPYHMVTLIRAQPDAKTAILAHARSAIGDSGVAAGCSVRLAGIDQWPGDALVVDVSEAEAAKAPKDEPRTACGDYGLDEDASVFWRPAGRYALWFNLGQDTAEVDAGSFVVVKDGAIRS